MNQNYICEKLTEQTSLKKKCSFQLISRCWENKKQSHFCQSLMMLLTPRRGREFALREEIMEALVMRRWGDYTQWEVCKHNAYFVKSASPSEWSNQCHYKTVLKRYGRVRKKLKNKNTNLTLANTCTVAKECPNGLSSWYDSPPGNNRHCLPYTPTIGNIFIELKSEEL